MLDCHCPEDEAGQEEEVQSDIVSIRNVSFQSAESEWKDLNYTLNADPMHWALYDHLMDFPAEVTLNTDQLVELSTALEHQEYITFLKDHKRFIKSR